MADQPAPATSTPAAPPAAAPAAPAPAATPPAPAAAAPAAPAAAAPPKKPQSKPGKGGKPKFDPDRLDQNPAAMKRVRQLAAQKATALVQEKFPGMSLDEAAELVKKAGAAIDGAAPAAGGAAPAAGSNRELESMRKRVAKLTEVAAVRKRKLIATKARARDEAVEQDLRMDALRAGILDEHTDFALAQYRKAVRNAKDEESIPDSLPYFQGLRGGAPYLFAAAGAAPPVVTLRPTTAPPVSNQPGAETPAPATPGAKPPQPDAFQMNDEQWKRHKGSYGFRG